MTTRAAITLAALLPVIALAQSTPILDGTLQDGDGDGIAIAGNGLLVSNVVVAGGAVGTTNAITATGYVDISSLLGGGAADGGATQIVAGASDSYDPVTRSLTWNTNAAGGVGDGTGAPVLIWSTNNTGYNADASYSIALPQDYTALRLSATMQASADANISAVFNNNTNYIVMVNGRDQSASLLNAFINASIRFGRVDNFASSTSIGHIYNYTSTVQRCTTESVTLSRYGTGGNVLAYEYHGQCEFGGPITNMALALSTGSFTNAALELWGLP